MKDRSWIQCITMEFIRDKRLWRPFAATHSCGTIPSCWRAKDAQGEEKQRAHIIWNGYFLCFSCHRASIALHHGSFAPCGWPPQCSYHTVALQHCCTFLGCHTIIMPRAQRRKRTYYKTYVLIRTFPYNISQNLIGYGVFRKHPISCDNFI